MMVMVVMIMVVAMMMVVMMVMLMMIMVVMMMMMMMMVMVTVMVMVITMVMVTTMKLELWVVPTDQSGAEPRAIRRPAGSRRSTNAMQFLSCYHCNAMQHYSNAM